MRSTKRPSMITDSNRVYFDKMLSRCLQELLNETSFSRFLERVDSKMWRVQLLICNRAMIKESKISGRNYQAG